MNLLNARTAAVEVIVVSEVEHATRSVTSLENVSRASAERTLLENFVKLVRNQGPKILFLFFFHTCSSN